MTSYGIGGARPAEVERYLRQLAEYRSLPGAESDISMRPCFGEDTEKHPMDEVYFYQDSWAFARIFLHHPSCVVDVGARPLLLGILSTLMAIVSVEIRPLPVSTPNLSRVQGSITALPFADESVELLSCLSVIEHIGLGRYGDRLDPLGSIRAFQEVTRVVKPGGHFILSVPVSPKGSVAFNAHRVFAKAQVDAMLSEFATEGELWINPTEEGHYGPKVARFGDLGEYQEFVWCADMAKIRMKQ